MNYTQTTYINSIALCAGKKGAHPAEVGVLASVFEKSVTELKQQKLLKFKQTIQIATFNVRTLNRIGQLPELTASAIEHKTDIICIQEHRYTHTHTHTKDIKYHDTGNGWLLATVSAWKNSANASVGGVGMLIGPRALKTLHSIRRIQLRMMAATFNGNPRATIISCYSPTNVSKETELVVFINKIWKNSAMNCEAYSSFEGVSSNHRKVTAKIRLSLRKNATRTATTKHYDWALLNNRDIRDKYVLRIEKQIRDTTREDRKRDPK